MKTAGLKAACILFVSGTSLMSLLFILVGVSTICESVLVSRWVAKPAEIQDVKLYLMSTRSHRRVKEVDLLQPDRPGNRQTYELETVFAYNYGDREYRLTQVAEQRDCSSKLPELARELAAHREVDTPARCFVNPADPGEAVIAKPAAKYLALAFGCIFSAVPLIAIRQLVPCKR